MINLEVTSITTDRNNSYPSIKVLRAIHHRYVFHIMKNLMNDIKEISEHSKTELNILNLKKKK